MPLGTKNMPPQENLSRESLCNWCDVDMDLDANTDINKTICQPQPYMGGFPFLVRATKIHFVVEHIGLTGTAKYESSF